MVRFSPIPAVLLNVVWGRIRTTEQLEGRRKSGMEEPAAGEHAAGTLQVLWQEGPSESSMPPQKQGVRDLRQGGTSESSLPARNRCRCTTAAAAEGRSSTGSSSRYEDPLALLGVWGNQSRQAHQEVPKLQDHREEAGRCRGEVSSFTYRN